MVHGDYFVSVGTREATQRFKAELEGRFEIKTQILGSGKGVPSARTRTPDDDAKAEVSEGRVLNRILRWTSDGWELEPDQRHADIIVHELGLLDAKPVCTAGETETRTEEGNDAVLLDAGTASKYRALAARANCKPLGAPADPVLESLIRALVFGLQLDVMEKRISKREIYVDELLEQKEE